MTMVQGRRIDEWPATPIQGWMQAHDEANPKSGYYVLPFTGNVAGRVDWRSFTAAFEAMCSRYPVLLASMRRGQESWVQSVRPYSDVPVEFRDATGLAGRELERQLTASYEYCRRPFILTQEPPIRVLVVQMADKWLVMGAFHQVACDLESMAVFNSEFWRLYEAFVDGTEPDLPAPARDFAEYAFRARSSLRIQEKNLTFWSEKLAGVDLRCPLPVDHPEAVANPVGPTDYIKIGGVPTARALHSIALEERCSEHAVVLAALALVLSKRSGRTSFVIGCPISLRRSAELWATFGPLNDMLWLPLDAVGSTLRENVQPVFRSIMQALSRHCPVDLVARQIRSGGDEGQPAGPNIQCQYFPPERISNPSWVSSSLKAKQVMPIYLLTGPHDSPFWLDLVIAGERNQPDTDISLVYRTDLFHRDTARDVALQIEAAIVGGGGPA